MRITACGITDVGMKRTNNEDNYLINDELNLFVVCDGMGGHVGGEYASAIAVNTVEEVLTAMGGERQQAFLKSLGLFDASPVELVEAKGAKPLQRHGHHRPCAAHRQRQLLHRPRRRLPRLPPA